MNDNALVLMVLEKYLSSEEVKRHFDAGDIKWVYDNMATATQSGSLMQYEFVSLLDSIGFDTAQLLEGDEYVPIFWMNGCETVKHFRIPSGVVLIKKYAFSHCSNLIDVTIPTSVKTVEVNAFSHVSEGVEGKKLTLYYEGDTAGFKGISLDQCWCLGSVVTVKCSDGELTYRG